MEIIGIIILVGFAFIYKKLHDIEKEILLLQRFSMMMDEEQGGKVNEKIQEFIKEHKL